MVSPLLVSFKQNIQNLGSSLIADAKDYDKYSVAEQHMALGFRLIATAHLEGFLENRCLDTALRAAQSHLAGQPTHASRCLLVWSAVRKSQPIPLDTIEHVQRELMDTATKQYQKVIDGNHGIKGDNLRGFLLPLGFRDSDISEHDELLDRLDSIAGRRNPAAHRAVKRTTEINLPPVEWQNIADVFPLLEKLDDALEKAVL